MRLWPWRKKYRETPEEIERRKARLAAMEAIAREQLEHQQELMRKEAEWRGMRTMSIPEDLEGWRLSHCTCGTEERYNRALLEAAARGRTGHMYLTSSAGHYHEEDCDRMTGIWIQIIEEDGAPPRPWREEPAKKDWREAAGELAIA